MGSHHQVKMKLHYLSNPLGSTNHRLLHLLLIYINVDLHCFEVLVTWNNYLKLSLQTCFLMFFVIQTIETKHSLVSV